MTSVNIPRAINFKLITRTLQGDAIVSVFEAPTVLKDRTYRLETTETPHGNYGHYSVI